MLGSPTLDFAGILVATISVIGLAFKIYIDGVRGKDRDRQQEKDRAHLSEISVKVNALWEIYGMDAIREARNIGLTQRNSPETTTEYFNSIFNGELKRNVEKFIKENQYRLPKDAIPTECYITYRKEFGQFAQFNDLSLKAVFGALQTYICNFLGCDEETED